MTINICDVKFPISMETLWETHILPVLPSYENMLFWHELLMGYIQNDSSILLIRKQKIDNRKECRRLIIVGEKSGEKMLCADNAPVWAVMKYCHDGLRFSPNEWKETIDPKRIPCHMFDVINLLGDDHYNSKGWHLAHIEDINDRSNPQGWDKLEVRRKCLKFIHPINYFPFPLKVWKGFGGNPTVNSYISKQYNTKYAEIRMEFLEYLGIKIILTLADSLTTDEKNLQITQDKNTDPGQECKNMEIQVINEIASLNFSTKSQYFQLADGRNGVYWKSARLAFKKDAIEKLKNAEDLIIINIDPTDKSSKEYKHGFVILTVSQFRKEFNNVYISLSYEKGNYNSPTPPSKMKDYFFTNLQIDNK